MIKIIFFGTSDFAVPALEALVKEGYEIAAVITTPDEPVGRKQTITPPPVKITAQKLDLKILQPEKLKNNKELVSCLLPLEPDIGIIASYGRIIPFEILDLPKRGFLNIHPSLLPKYRGPSPIQNVLLSDDRETGVSIMKVDEQVDHGPVLAYSLELIADSEKYEDLYGKLAKIGADLLVKILPDYLSGKIRPVAQDHSQATFTKFIKKADGRIDWHKTAGEIYNQFRAFHLWPGIWTSWQGKTLKITDCKISDRQAYHGHDEIYISKVYQEDDEVYVPSGIGHIDILRVQLEGGKEMFITDFLAGHKDFIGSKLG